MKLKSITPSVEAAAFRDAFVGFIAKWQHLPADQLLAIAAYATGQLIALQDQRKMTPDMAMKLVAENLQLGNQQAIAQFRDAPPAGRG